MATLRLALLIIVITIATGWLVQRVELLYKGPYIAGVGAFPGDRVFLALPLGALGALALLRRFIGPGDRAVLYAALVVGASATASGLMHRFLPGLVTGFYGGFARETGDYWRFLQVVPDWLVPGGPNSLPAVAAFEGGPVPWGAWAWPLAAWSAFFGAFFTTCFCLVWLLRQRWLETERLGFPLLEMPRALIAGELFAHRLFWWGLLVPTILYGVNGLHHYFPAVPEITAALNLADLLLDDPWKAMATFESPFYFDFVPLLVGVAFLAPVEVSFSTWIFYMFTRVQLLLTHFLGRLEYRGDFIPGHGSPWLDWPSHFPFFMNQARGGLLFIGVFSLWAARRALREALSWKSGATWGLLLGLLFMWGWVIALGIPPLLGLLTLLLVMLLALACARLRIDGGLPITGMPLIIGYMFFVVMGTGADLFSDATYMGFGFLAVFGFTVVGAWPALQLEGLKLAELGRVSARRMAWGMGLGLLAGLAAGFYFSLEMIYEHGIFVLQEQGGARSEARIGRYYNYLFKDAGTVEGPTDWLRLAFHAVGAGVTWLLTILRQYFLRWPLHPMGFVFGTGFGWLVWGSVFCGWLCKWLAVRYGGARTYRRVLPFFLGMIFGEVCMRLLWAAVALWQSEMGGGYRI